MTQTGKFDLIFKLSRYYLEKFEVITTAEAPALASSVTIRPISALWQFSNWIKTISPSADYLIYFSVSIERRSLLVIATPMVAFLIDS
jgi:hypothetical protein